MIDLDTHSILFLNRALNLASVFCMLSIVNLSSPAPDEFSCSIVEPKVSEVKLLFRLPNQYLYERIYEGLTAQIPKVPFSFLVTSKSQITETELSNYTESTQDILQRGFSGTNANLTNVNCSVDPLGVTQCLINGYMSFRGLFFSNYYRHIVSFGELRVKSHLICSLTMVHRYSFEPLDILGIANHYDKTPRGRLTMMSELADKNAPFIGFYLKLSPYNVPAAVKPRGFMMCGRMNVSLDIRRYPILKAKTSDVAGHTRCELQIYNNFKENSVIVNFRLIEYADSKSFVNDSANNDLAKLECECIVWKNSSYTLIGAAALTILLCISSRWWDRCCNACLRPVEIYVANTNPLQAQLKDLPDYKNEIGYHRPLSPETSMEPESSMLTSSIPFQRSTYGDYSDTADPYPSENSPRPLRLPADPIEPRE